jgi:TonB-dependent receptor
MLLSDRSPARGPIKVSAFLLLHALIAWTAHAATPTDLEASSPTTPATPAPDLSKIEEGTSSITGEISDATTLEPLSGAIVSITGTNRSAETDTKGRFQISGIPAANLSLEVFKLGYYNEVTPITTLNGETFETRISLRAKPGAESDDEFTLEEETIIGEYQESSTGDLFLDLDLGANLVSGVSKEQFSRMGISDAAGAVSKIAGANIVGGKYAVVRGLGDRYSNTLVNGALISSADPSKKAVQLDLFPSDLLESVAISKTATADLPAEFAGGMVLLQTLTLPKERILEFELGIETNTELDGKFFTGPNKEYNFWGKSKDSIPLQELPDGFLSRGHTGSRAPSNPEELAAAAEGAAQMEKLHSSAGMRPKERDPNEKHNFGVTYGDTFELANDIRIGGVLSFTHEQGDKARRGMKVGRGVNFGSDFAPGGDGTPESDDFIIRSQLEDRFTHFVNWGALASIGVEVGDHHQISFTWFKNRSAEEEVVMGRRIRDIGGEFPEYLASGSNPFGAGAYTYQAFDQIQPLERDLELMQMDGRHRIGGDQYAATLDWSLSRSDAEESRPHTRTLYFSELDFADPRIATLQNDITRPELGTVTTAADIHNSSPPLVTSYRESLSTKEHAGNERIDLTLPIWDHSDTKSFEFKIGGNHFKRDREVRGRFFDYGFSPTLNNNLLGNGGQDGVDYLENFDNTRDSNGNLKFNGWTGPQAASQNPALILTESTLVGRTVRNVDAGNEVRAFYLMSSLNNESWGGNAGLRHEDEERYYQVLPGLNAFAFVNEEPVYNENDYFLPSMTLWRKFGNTSQFKTTAAWSKTIARPTFYEYAPVEVEDQSSGDVIIGNPDLVDTEIDNFDFEISWEPTPETQLTLGAFRKDMTSPIAQAFDAEKKTWVNGETGTLQGFEITAFQQLGGGWDISGNYTYIDSTLRYTQQINSLGETQEIESSFEGQPAHILNLMLGYEYEPWKTRVSLVYNLTGSYLTGVPATADSSAILREKFQLLDLIISKDFAFMNCDGSVKLKLVNLLDSEDRQVFEGTNLVYQSFHQGRGISLSAEIKF